MPTKSQPTALVTGCSSGGLGASLCLAFRQQNYHVFATARDPNKAASLEQDGIEVLALDVTSSESIEKCVAHVVAKTGGTLDVLVNNAGLFKVVPALDASIAESRKVYEVNVFGLLAVTQAFSPLLIKSRGVVVNISSIQAVLSMVYHGIYASSKAAVTSLSEILRIELEPFGVRVITGQIGAVDTKIYENHEALRAVKQPQKKSLYAPVESNIEDAATGRVIPSTEPPEKTARDIVRDVMSGKDGLIWRGAMAGKTRLLTRILPGRMLEKSLSAGRGLEKLQPPKN